MPNNNQNQKNTLDDIKTLFDGITNLGLCATLAIGIQFLQEPMINAGIPDGLRAFLNLLAFVMSCFLTFMALVWLGLSFKTKPSCKAFHYFSLALLALVTIAIMGVLTYSSYNNVPFKFF